MGGAQNCSDPKNYPYQERWTISSAVALMIIYKMKQGHEIEW